MNQINQQQAMIAQLQERVASLENYLMGVYFCAATFEQQQDIIGLLGYAPFICNGVIMRAYVNQSVRPDQVFITE
jgi:hypothetical protein